MSDRRGRFALLSLLLLPAAPLRAQDPNELLRLADEPRKAYREALIRVRVTNFEHGQPGPASEFDLYKKGEDRGLIVFRTGTQKGRKILTVGEKFWLVVPGAKHAIPVSANQRLVGGASMVDAARLSFADFAASLAGTEEIDGTACDVLALTARAPTSAYGSGKVWLDKKEHLARKAVLNLVSGRPAKEISFEEYGRDGRNIVLKKMRLRDLPQSKTQAETLLEYVSYQKANIEDDVFTPEGALKFSAD
jgi:hypothetical protein